MEQVSLGNTAQLACRIRPTVRTYFLHVFLTFHMKRSFSYVYHVHAKNFTGFLEAIESAIKTPIDRYEYISPLSTRFLPGRRLIPEHMTEKAVKERLTKLMETDWRTKAEEVLEENMKKVEQGEEAYVGCICAPFCASFHTPFRFSNFDTQKYRFFGC